MKEKIPSVTSLQIYHHHDNALFKQLAFLRKKFWARNFGQEKFCQRYFGCFRKKFVKDLFWKKKKSIKKRGRKKEIDLEVI